jgi:hypothetical protein
MKIPSFIKQIVKCCDTEASKYALGGVKCESDGQIARLTATDGRVMVSVQSADDGPAVDAVVDGKTLAAIPAAALRSKHSVEFLGDRLEYHDKPGFVSVKVDPLEGRFPRYEDVFDSIYASGTDRHAVVKLDAAMLRKLADVADAMDPDGNRKGITLFVGASDKAVFATCRSEDGYIARMVVMPRVEGEGTDFSFPTAGSTPAFTTPEPKPKRDMVVQNTTVYPDGRRVPGDTVNVTTGKVLAPPPEMLDDDAIAEAVTREPACIGIIEGDLDPVS